MRFTRYSATVLLVMALALLVVVGILYFHVLPFEGDALSLQAAFLFMLILPLVVSLVGFLIIVSGRHSFHYARHPHMARHEAQNPAPEQTQKDDQLTHLAIGMLVSLTQDFSRGMVVNREIYGRHLLSMLEQELSYLRVYIDRGYRFHFAFHHDAPYRAYVRYPLSKTDVVIEIDGAFDYYFEREGERHPTPHGYDTNPPLISVPAVMRLRIVHDKQSGHWKLVGFSDSIRGLKMGLPTE